MELVLMVGPSGSGKSSYSRAHFPNHVYISQDEQGPTKHQHLFWDALKANKDIVVDRMNHTVEQRSRYLVPAKAAGYITRIVVLHENKEICLDRAIKRQGHPTVKTPEQAEKAVSHFFTRYERVEDFEADTVSRVFPNGQLYAAVVSDLDGTLANCDHRLQHAKGPEKDWDKFFSLIGKDTINHDCSMIIANVYDASFIAYATARPEKYRTETLDWLERNDMDIHDKLIMRPEGDYRPDFIVKEIMLEFELKTRYHILFWMDDSPEVIKMLKKHDIKVIDFGK